MEWWMFLVIGIIYCGFSFIDSIFFNWKIMLLGEKRFQLAGIFDSASTIMFIFSVIIIAVIGWDEGNVNWALIPVIAISMGLGNFFAAILVPKLKVILDKKIQDRSK